MVEVKIKEKTYKFTEAEIQAIMGDIEKNAQWNVNPISYAISLHDGNIYHQPNPDWERAKRLMS